MKNHLISHSPDLSNLFSILRPEKKCFCLKYVKLTSVLYIARRFIETVGNESASETELLVNESAVAHTLLRCASHKHLSGVVMQCGLRRQFKV